MITENELKAAQQRVLAIMKANKVKVSDQGDSLRIEQGGRQINLPLINSSTVNQTNSFR